MSEKTDLAAEVFADMKNEGLGFTATLRKKTQGAYNTSTGLRAITNVDTTCYIVFKKILPSQSLPKYFE